MAKSGFVSLLKTTYTEWSEHDAPRLGASVAFYSILSFAPLLVLTVAVIALAFGKSSAQSALIGEAQQLMGERGATMVDSLLKNAQKPSSGIFSSIIAFITLLFGASGVFTELRDALDIMWNTKRKKASGVWAMVKDRLFSFGMVLSVGFLLLVSLLLSAVLAFLGHAFSELLPLPPFVLQLVNFALSFGVIAALFALMFKYMPAAKTAWRDVIVGALGTAFLFTVGKFLLGIYIGKASVGSTYGAAGSLVAVVVWIYYSAQIFFFGAEFTHIYAESHAGVVKDNPRSEPEPPKAAAPEPLKAMTAVAAASATRMDAPVAQPVTSPAAGASRAAAMPAAPVASPRPAEPAASFPVQPGPASLSMGRPVGPTTSSIGPVGPTTKPKLLMALGVGFLLGRLFVQKERSIVPGRKF